MLYSKLRPPSQGTMFWTGTLLALLLQYLLLLVNHQCNHFVNLLVLQHMLFHMFHLPFMLLITIFLWYKWQCQLHVCPFLTLIPLLYVLLLLIFATCPLDQFLFSLLCIHRNIIRLQFLMPLRTYPHFNHNMSLPICLHLNALTLLCTRFTVPLLDILTHPLFKTLFSPWIWTQFLYHLMFMNHLLIMIDYNNFIFLP